MIALPAAVPAPNHDQAGGKHAIKRLAHRDMRSCGAAAQGITDFGAHRRYNGFLHFDKCDAGHICPCGKGHARDGAYGAFKTCQVHRQGARGIQIKGAALFVVEFPVAIGQLAGNLVQREGREGRTAGLAEIRITHCADIPTAGMMRAGQVLVINGQWVFGAKCGADGTHAVVFLLGIKGKAASYEGPAIKHGEQVDSKRIRLAAQ
jgi:hypothetical protein